MPPQTVGKHMVLRDYLGAWLGILGQREQRIVFVDGFAGPGQYEGGEQGSPLIALDVFEKHSAVGRIIAKPVFLFLEDDLRRHAHLSALVAPIASRLGNRADLLVKTGRFDVTMSGLLDNLESTGSGLAPAFVMVDPFGVSHVPMALMARILANKKSEIFVSFMYEAINRHHTTEEFEPHLDDLFGTDQWRQMEAIADPRARKQFALNLYESQLRDAGAEYVTRFELWDEGRFVYAIYFATGNALGCDRMKQAIWNADPTGEFQFRAGGDGQMMLLGANLRVLEQQLQGEFSGNEVGIEKLEAWIQTDATQFHSGQLKKTLKAMEDTGLLTVTDGTRQRKGTFPAGTRLTILP